MLFDLPRALRSSLWVAELSVAPDVRMARAAWIDRGEKTTFDSDQT